jgi:hypothetical protein
VLAGPCRHTTGFSLTWLSPKKLGWEGLVAKSVAKNNWHVGFCRQPLPRVQNLKKTLVGLGVGVVRWVVPQQQQQWWWQQ